MCVTESRLLVGRRFSLGENVVDVRRSSINTLELITKSIIPPLALAVIALIVVTLIWWIPGQQKFVLPRFPYDYIAMGTASVLFGALVGAWWRRWVGVLRIEIAGAYKPITVKLVNNNKASVVFQALKA